MLRLPSNYVLLMDMSPTDLSARVSPAVQFLRPYPGASQVPQEGPLKGKLRLVNFRFPEFRRKIMSPNSFYVEDAGHSH